jgi:4-hydroxythreonine-4-phosphate dehydrogenase
MKKIAITLGDANSISPEITIKALNFLNLPKENVILIANKNIFEYYKEHYNLSLLTDYEIIDIPYSKNDIEIGKETKKSGEFAFNALKMACILANKGGIDAIVTAPVSKNALHLAGHNYSGQTEIIEKYIAKQNQAAEMLFVCEKFNVMLLTRHIALKDVPAFIKKDFIVEKTKRLVNSLTMQLNIRNPKIAICALNPHSGENGLFGNEEILEIIPAVNELKSMGIDINGPFPSDSLFSKCTSNYYDCYIAMYHDQGLIPIKLLERDNCVNTTIGLDVLRTSPAHGTAFDIAGKNIANENSMINAIKLAIK